jgi:hypothetical protein
MGWFTEGSDHEGYVVCVFADGRYGSEIKDRQIELRTPQGLAVSDSDDPHNAQRRPPSQVVGWKVACDCVPFQKHVVLDPLWTRVWDPAEEDLPLRRIYAGDPSSKDPLYVSDRDDLERLFQDRWQQHIAADLALHTIRTLGQDLKKIEVQLDEAVAAARSEGISWEKIGRAFGISRQGAQKRWDTASATASLLLSRHTRPKPRSGQISLS